MKDQQVPPADDGAVDVALAAYDATVESGGRMIEQQVRRRAMKVPGTVVVMPSGRQYRVHADGSLRRVDG